MMKNAIKYSIQTNKSRKFNVIAFEIIKLPVRSKIALLNA